jgi:molecular chaperone GrpE
MRALADTENTRRHGERRVQDAQQFRIPNFAHELLQVVDNLRRTIDAGATDTEATKTGGLEGVAATDRILTQVLNRFGVRGDQTPRRGVRPQKTRRRDRDRMRRINRPAA